MHQLVHQNLALCTKYVWCTTITFHTDFTVFMFDFDTILRTPAWICIFLGQSCLTTDYMVQVRVCNFNYQPQTHLTKLYIVIYYIKNSMWLRFSQTYKLYRYWSSMFPFSSVSLIKSKSCASDKIRILINPCSSINISWCN